MEQMVVMCFGDGEEMMKLMMVPTIINKRRIR